MINVYGVIINYRYKHQVEFEGFQLQLMSANMTHVCTKCLEEKGHPLHGLLERLENPKFLDRDYIKCLIPRSLSNSIKRIIIFFKYLVAS